MKKEYGRFPEDMCQNAGNDRQFAVVTGATEGIGFAIAKLLAEKGYSLILTARNEEKLVRIRREWEDHYAISVITHACDLTAADQVLGFFDVCLPYHPVILINNAGMGVVGEFERTALKEDIATLKLNVEAAHVLFKLFVQNMERGYILNTASLAGFLPGPGMAAYGAGKAYLIQLSRSVAYELKRSNSPISVSTFAPGPVRTGFDQKAGVKKVRSGLFAFGTLTPERCARYAVDGMFWRKELICPGFPAKLLHAAARMLPTRLLFPIEYRIQRKKAE